MGGIRFPIPARDRILLHLSDFCVSRDGEGSYPPSLTQDGIASRTGLGRAHVALALKSLREEGLVEEIKGRVAGEVRRRKVYALSEPGRGHSRNLLSALMDVEVAIRVEGAEERRAKLSEASFLLPRKMAHVDLALSVGEGGVLTMGAGGLPVAPSREQEREPPEIEEDGEETPVPSPGPAPGSQAAVAAPPSPASAFGPDETDGYRLAGAGQRDDERWSAGMSLPPPETPTPKPDASRPVPTVSPWVRRGGLAAVWTGALVLACVFIWLGEVYGEPATPEQLVLFFLTMFSLQAVLLGLKMIPPNVRAELGLFLGIFLALYGGFMALAPSFVNLLWFTEGLLLLLTGLLLHPLDGNRRFQTAAAGVGAFVILLSLEWMPRSANLLAAAFLVLWMLVGGLLLLSRFYHGDMNYTASLLTAAKISFGCFLMSLGAFMVSRGFLAESLVEFLVGLVIIYYAAPKKPKEWNRTVLACTLTLCVMVVLTTLLVLLTLLGGLTYFQGS